MSPEYVSLLMGGDWLDAFAPASAAQEATDPAIANTTYTEDLEQQDILLLIQVATEHLRPIHPIKVFRQDLEVLTQLEPLAAFASDQEVHEALARIHRVAGTVLPDGADPAVLWRVADRLGLTVWPIKPTLRDDRVLVAVDVARAVGLVPELPFVAERRAALAALLAREDRPPAKVCASDEASVPHRSGLPLSALDLLRHGHLALGPLPSDSTEEAVSVRTSTRRRRHLPGRQRRRVSVPEGEPTLDLAEVSADPASERLLAPVILASPPASSEAAEQTALARLQRLQLPVDAVTAPDPKSVRGALTGVFPWFGTAIDALTRELALSRLGGGPARLPPLLLHGPPGTGKSRFSRALAKACGLPLWRIAGPDASVVTVLAGIGRGWRSPQASAPLEAIAALGVRNPILLIDDADRMPTGTHNGDPRAVLLALLERNTARGYLDPLLAVPCDISAVNWILTANEGAALGDALLDRLHQIEIPPPPASAFDTIITGMMADLAAEYGLAPGRLPAIPDDVRVALRRAFTDEGTALRRVARALRAALGAIASGADPLIAATEVLAAAQAARGHAIGFVRSSSGRA